MNEIYNSSFWLPWLQLFLAIIILIVGCWIAAWIAKKVGAVLGKTSLFHFVGQKLYQDEDKTNRSVISFIVKLIYYVLVIFVIIAAAERLGFTQFTKPLVDFLNPIFSYLPNIFGGLILLLIAVFFSRLGKYFTLQFCNKIELDKKVQVSDTKRSISLILADLVSLAIFIIILPGILSSLKLNGILQPVTNMLNNFLIYLPNLIAAILILVIGWFIAYKLKDIFTNLMKSLNIEEKTKIGDKQIFQGNLPNIVGNVVYVLILLPVVTAALRYLGLTFITAPIINMLVIVFNYIPLLVGVAILLFVAIYFANIIENIITNILTGLKFDSYLEKIGMKSNGNAYSKLIGKFTKILVIYFAIIQSIEILNFTLLKDLSIVLTLLLGDILLGLITIGVGIFLAVFTANFIKSSGLKYREPLSIIAKVFIIILVGAMGLGQMGISTEIINLAFGFLVGAIALAIAIAFGVGGIDFAKDKLSKLSTFCEEEKEKISKSEEDKSMTDSEPKDDK
jgi:hypothetical protein